MSQPFDRFESLDGIMEHALSLGSPARERFLEEVRERSQELYDQARRLLERAADTTVDPLMGQRPTAFEPGHTLGDFRIEKKIGAGGMGEVYAAVDRRLDRRVAIKVLPTRIRLDPALRERFLREARAISQLQHPNICVLHDVGESDGVDFLVMELLEGETLAARIARSRMPYREALTIGAQVGRALAHAHQNGVVHRDVKPGNVMLTRDGAKLLDFGLARFEAQPVDSGTAAPTLSEEPLTTAGAVMGTLQYMSPEQLEGRQATAQSDVFAFGAMLFEMLTGRRAFSGDSHAALISSILKDDPGEVSKRQPSSTRELDRVVGICLEKDPEKRWQSMADLAREVDWLASQEEGDLAGLHEPPVKSRSRALRWAASLAMLALAVAAGVAWSGRPVERPTPAARQFEVGSGVPRFSPDGTQFVAETASGWLIHDLQLGESRPFPHPASVRPFYSPDGEWWGFWEAGALKKVPVSGGEARTLASGIEPYRRTHWASNGLIYLAQEAGLYVVSENGGEPRLLLEAQADERLLHPSLLPDGHSILHTSQAKGRIFGKIRVVDSEGSIHTLVEDGRDPIYHEASGLLFFGRRSTLHAAAFDLKTLQMLGEPRPVFEYVPLDVNLGTHDYSLSRAGDLVAATFREVRSQLVLVSRDGRVEVLAEEQGRLNGPRLSPDGRTVAVSRGRGVLDDDIWLLDRERGVWDQVTFGGGYSPLFHPDGRSLVFSSVRDIDTWKLFRKELGSLSPPTALVDGDAFRFAASFTSKGRQLVYREYGQNNLSTDIGLLDLESGKTELLLASSFRIAAGGLSPDDRWLAYHSDESSIGEIYVDRFDSLGQEAKRRVSVGGGFDPVWARDGSELYFRGNGAMWACTVALEGTEIQFGAPTRLFDDVYETFGVAYDVTLDGRFLMVRIPGQPSLKRTLVVTDWASSLTAGDWAAKRASRSRAR